MPEQGVVYVPHETIITFEEIVKLCEYFGALGIRKVKITGGEPLVRKNLPYLIKCIKSVKGINKVTLTTNGILLKEQIMALVDAGLDGVNISLDTLDDNNFEKLTRFHHLDKVKEGIKAALEYENVIVKINCVPIKEFNNRESILNMIELARYQNLHVRFIQIMPIGLGKNLCPISEEEIKCWIRESYSELTPFEDIIGNGPSRYYSIRNFTGKIGFISAVDHQFCDDCNRVRLTSSGVLKSCLQYASGVNLKQLLREGKSDQELIQSISDCIYHKPREHQFKTIKANQSAQGSVEIKDKEPFEGGNMSEIGG